ncbi:MAG: D-tyrosyl-tRNA(Tyr) deacylase [Planctomycetia bacterium]|nr:D-tyrosyl-tRNA(Tyr) deacylase [Planctomycetia bacterium]MCC7316527.1 D-tyrosyl-tRNA(Tyr) deacylase [Planctomycetota bacterium]OQY96591.1 MAG: D-tyrosyl-tRNA(Tyr) deacylase [Planctomycetes bacterium UTPLA1]
MRIIVQRVGPSAVVVDGTETGRIDRGLLLYVGIGREDSDEDAAFLAKKIATLRIFEDDAGKMNLDVSQIGGAALAISNFSLYADTSRGRRPAFVDAAPPEQAVKIYEQFCAELRALGVHVETGRFRETMAVHSVNDGPINIILESPGRTP